MNANNFPPYPLLPRQPSSSQLSVSQATQTQSETVTSGVNRDSTTAYSDNTQYMIGLYNALVPRVQAFESKQEELALIIHKERFLEEVVRKIVHLHIMYSIIIPFGVFLIVTLFFWLQYPAESVEFYKNWIGYITFSAVLAIFAFVKPFLLIREYIKRLELIEKKLKLNGND